MAIHKHIVYGVDATAISCCATAIASIPELYTGHKRLAWPHVFAPLLPTALVAYAGSPAPARRAPPPPPPPSGSRAPPPPPPQLVEEASQEGMV